MAQFPRRQTSIASLADKMIVGLETHPQYFPHNDVAVVQAALAQFNQAAAHLQAAEAAAKSAATAKAAQLEKLQATLKGQLLMARADCAEQPELLSYIGYNGRRRARAITPPASPHNLLVRYDNDMRQLAISWDKPSFDRHRPVRTYLLQQRPADCSRAWRLLEVCYDNYYLLELNAPPAERMLYRVIASNDQGSSLPSNEAAG